MRKQWEKSGELPWILWNIFQNRGEWSTRGTLENLLRDLLGFSDISVVNCEQWMSMLLPWTMWCLCTESTDWWKGRAASQIIELQPMLEPRVSPSRGVEVKKRKVADGFPTQSTVCWVHNPAIQAWKSWTERGLCVLLWTASLLLLSSFQPMSWKGIAKCLSRVLSVWFALCNHPNLEETYVHKHWS